MKRFILIIISIAWIILASSEKQTIQNSEVSSESNTSSQTIGKKGKSWY
ncbi:hypothetical protein [Reichenbachiella sp. 5M10]|nr:hypothetical protein [Reichenbachiella sp. 5M10]